MTVINEAIQDRVRQRRLAEIGVPGVDRGLAGHERGCGVDPVIEDFNRSARS